MTESTGNQDWADKIAKLLAKAESATAAEAELLTAKAEQLMAKFAISRAQLDEKRRLSGHAGESIITTAEPFDIHGSYAVPIAHLFWTVIHLSDNVQGFQIKHNGHTRIYLVGYESDVEQLKLLLASLEIQASMAMREFWSSPATISRVSYMTGSQKWNERRAFIMGFASGVAKRLNTVREVNKSEPGTDLVLARGARVKQHVADTMNLKTSSARLNVGGSRDARNAGHIAGTNSNTGGPTVGQRGQLA